ncbi:hypothetical protein BU17DRAFT_102920 [Hysterangium stoloniferum]|nr:hypothetical protein BU17DRAFT_102920 [Hysterangium stoloniferum]
MGRQFLKDEVYELQDLIASFISLPKDLLSLALTCRTLYTLIVPDHLEFRHVYCDPRKLHVWEALLSRPRLTARLRSLILLKNSITLSAEVIPRTIVENNDLNRQVDKLGHNEACLTALANLIHITPVLRQLAWNDFQVVKDETLMKNFFVAMRDNCRYLQELQMHCTTLHAPLAWISVISNPMHVFSNLTRFSIYLTGYRLVDGFTPYNSTLVDILVDGMPALCDLHIDGLSLRLPRLMERGHWSSLQGFTIKFDFAPDGASDTETAAVLAGFLEKHPKLQRFSLSQLLSPGSIPVTAAFRSLTFNYNANLFAVKDIVPLQTLQHIHSLDSTQCLDSGSITMLSHMPCLRYLTGIYQSDLSQVVQLAPYLERLFVVWLEGREYRSNEAKNSAIEALVSLKNLTHLGQMRWQNWGRFGHFDTST